MPKTKSRAKTDLLASEELNERQMLFVQEYMKDFNATQAAIRAGYSKKTAGNIGNENLRKPPIQKALHLAMESLAKRTGLTQEWIIEQLQINHKRAMQAEPVYDRSGEETGEYKYEGSVANKSLELMGKHIGMWRENIKVDVEGEVKHSHGHVHLHAEVKEIDKDEKLTEEQRIRKIIDKYQEAIKGS